MRLAIGVDVHSKKSTAHAVYAGMGNAPKRHQNFVDSFNKEFLSFHSTFEGMGHLVEFLGSNEYEILIENSTKSHEIYWILTNLGCKVTVAFAADLYRITKSVKKTDKNDSVELAGYMRRRMNGEREFAECYIPSPEWMIRREMCRAYLSDGEHLADLKRRIRSHLSLHGLKLSREYSDTASPKAREEMDKFDDPYLVILCSDAEATIKRRVRTKRVIEDMFRDDRNYNLILTIPGFATVSATYISAQISDFSRFSSKEQFAAYFGVVPKMHASADSNPRCSTTHRGDEDMRKLLFMCIQVHIRWVENSVPTKMFVRLKAGGKPHKEALTAAVRKMLTVIYSMLRTGCVYSEDQGTSALAETLRKEITE